MLYLKDGEEISSFLALMGANKSVIKFEEIRVMKETRNNINRLVNCETANLNKIIDASIKQVNAIKKLKKEKKFEDITLKEAIIIGISQAFAVIPGFSRSGTTILAGRLQGISKEAITKFTFLLSVPVICGATVLKVTDLALTKEVIVGIISSFAMGIIAIKFLLNYIKKHDFSVFAFYRVILALVVFIKLIFFK